MLQSADLGDMFPLVALHTLDDYFTCGAALRLTRFLCFGFRCFLLGVFVRALLGVDAKS